MDNYHGTNFNFCPNCGEPCMSKQKFCSSCGSSLSADNQQDSNQQNVYRQDTYQQDDYRQQDDSYKFGQNERESYNQDLFAFLQKNEYYYIERFNKFETAHTSMSWNWPAALFGTSWFVYRKMYWQAAVCYVAVLLSYAMPDMWTALLWQTAVWVLAGMFSNFIYYKHVTSRLEAARGIGGEELKRRYIRAKGGTSAGAVWTLIGIAALIGVLSGLFL